MGTPGIYKQDKHQDDKPKFYADAETLKEYYKDVDQLPVTGTWLENCTWCKIPMHQLQITSEVSSVLHKPPMSMAELKEGVDGIVFEDQKQWSKVFKQWLMDPVININNVGGADKFWFCNHCKSIWAIVSGQFWARISMNGLSVFDLDKIKVIKLSKQEVVMAEEFDPGPAPSPEHTQCPAAGCKRWREIKPYSETHVQHYCANCNTCDLFRKAPEPVKEIQETQEA
jgi:hypothetical protein